MNSQHIDDLNKLCDKLIKDKITTIKPVPMSEYETHMLNTIHELSLPTVREIYAEIAIELLKYMCWISSFLVIWWCFSAVMDKIFV